jgi:hypothetical protein
MTETSDWWTRRIKAKKGEVDRERKREKERERERERDRVKQKRKRIKNNCVECYFFSYVCHHLSI